MQKVWVLVVSSAISVSCSPASGDLGAQYAEECDALIGNQADPEVFTHPDKPDSRAELAAIAFEQETVAWSSGMKGGRRPDFELIVGHDDESAGYGCEAIGVGGYTVASVLAYGSEAPDVYYAKRISNERIIVMVGLNGATPEPRLFLDVKSDEHSIERIYPTESGEVRVPGITMMRNEDASIEICDHRGGHFRKLAPNGATIETIRNGCENQETTSKNSAAPPSLKRYDEAGNAIDELWKDETGRPGHTEFRNVMDDRGSWTSRSVIMKVADSPEPLLIREEFRYIRYRSNDR